MPASLSRLALPNAQCGSKVRRASAESLRRPPAGHEGGVKKRRRSPPIGCRKGMPINNSSHQRTHSIHHVGIEDAESQRVSAGVQQTTQPSQNAARHPCLRCDTRRSSASGRSDILTRGERTKSNAVLNSFEKQVACLPLPPRPRSTGYSLILLLFRWIDL